MKEYEKDFGEVRVKEQKDEGGEKKITLDAIEADSEVSSLNSEEREYLKEEED